MSGINALIQRLEKIATSEVKATVAEKTRAAIHDECLQGFIEQRDPYGNAWAPRKNGGSWKILDKTGKGVESLSSDVVGDSVRIRIVGFFKFHQTGTSRMQPRRIFPSPSYGLGRWAQRINDAALEGVRELMKG